MSGLDGMFESRADIRRAESRYFRALTNQIEYSKLKAGGKDYSKLLTYLNEREFYHKVPHDENRKADGLQLRIDAGVADYIGYNCTMLEMLVAFARRIDQEIISGSGAAKWFWIMMENCGLDEFDNENWDEPGANYIISLVNYRGYGMDGKGGLFPLKNPKEDQRKVELWYQMQAYILENYEI